MDGVKSKNSRQRSGIINICIVIICYYEFKNRFELGVKKNVHPNKHK